jgi:hypothetical protein
LKDRPVYKASRELFAVQLEYLLCVNFVITPIDAFRKLYVKFFPAGILASDCNESASLIYVAEQPVSRALLRLIRHQRRKLLRGAIENIDKTQRLAVLDRANLRCDNSMHQAARDHSKE